MPEIDEVAGRLDGGSGSEQDDALPNNYVGDHPPSTNYRRATLLRSSFRRRHDDQ
jgi:hypothetical protein